MDVDPAPHDEAVARGYAVTLVGRTSNDHHLQPPLELPEGITGEIDGPEVVLTVPVRAVNARSALEAAQVTVTDLLMTLASTFNGYEIVVDQRLSVSRTDAVDQADGLPPPFDVAIGVISDAGAEWMDPSGELRRAGRVLMFHGNAMVTHPPAG